MDSTVIRNILKKHWGYESFRPLQEDIIMSVLSGRDTLGLMPTGGGKSITFQVPAMALPGLTVVVTPDERSGRQSQKAEGKGGVPSFRYDGERIQDRKRETY